MAGNLPGLDRREDAALAVDVMELLQDGNWRAKGNKSYRLVISFHPQDQRLPRTRCAPTPHNAKAARRIGSAGKNHV